MNVKKEDWDFSVDEDQVIELTALTRWGTILGDGEEWCSFEEITGPHGTWNTSMVTIVSRVKEKTTGPYYSIYWRRGNINPGDSMFEDQILQEVIPKEISIRAWFNKETEERIF